MEKSQWQLASELSRFDDGGRREAIERQRALATEAVSSRAPAVPGAVDALYDPTLPREVQLRPVPVSGPVLRRKEKSVARPTPMPAAVPLVPTTTTAKARARATILTRTSANANAMTRKS